MFAASWALLAVGLLWPRRRTLTIAILLVWAMGVMKPPAARDRGHAIWL